MKQGIKFFENPADLRSKLPGPAIKGQGYCISCNHCCTKAREVSTTLSGTGAFIFQLCSCFHRRVINIFAVFSYQFSSKINNISGFPCKTAPAFFTYRDVLAGILQFPRCDVSALYSLCCEATALRNFLMPILPFAVYILRISEQFFGVHQHFS